MIRARIGSDVTTSLTPRLWFAHICETDLLDWKNAPLSPQCAGSANPDSGRERSTVFVERGGFPLGGSWEPLPSSLDFWRMKWKLVQRRDVKLDHVLGDGRVGNISQAEEEAQGPRELNSHTREDIPILCETLLCPFQKGNQRSPNRSEKQTSDYYKGAQGEISRSPRMTKVSPLSLNAWW